MLWAGGGGALSPKGRGQALRKGALGRAGRGLAQGRVRVERAAPPRPRRAGPVPHPPSQAAFPAGAFMRRAGKGRWGRHVAAAPEQVGVGVSVGTGVLPFLTVPGLRCAGWGLSRIGGSEGLGALGWSRVACTNPDDARGFAPLRIADFQEVLGEPTVALSKLRELCFSGECRGDRPGLGRGLRARRCPGLVPPGTGCPLGDHPVDSPSSVPGGASCPSGRKSIGRPACEVTSASRGERWANVVISLPGVPQEFPLMVGCAACAGRWVLLGALFFLASDALG